jgi:hypothetical protein
MRFLLKDQQNGLTASLSEEELNGLASLIEQARREEGGPS